jgi:hypothetical protein
MSNIVPVEVIAEKIFEMRGQKVMIDADLADSTGCRTSVSMKQ